ncbi:Methyltransferase type 11 [Thalassoporum mexicanum PCC 7367]|uniref:class I SAM-dependent methyltransferase n=1 Tax=Thalassoporum mexicanum TaxID=3457544 RepID=UPI00029F9388|nr:class I SAM-dependent methyltransferase [Pseudanabaena sp. PCC 7367]AFY70712.1 Methyltransferase type 11 [Pseudanabaena sp. PCC 7367]
MPAINYEIPKPQSSPDWEKLIAATRKRFDKEYKQESFDLPDEIEAMPLFREWVGHTLSSRTSSPFWEIAQFKKNLHCLDIGCGVSFLIYPWNDWNVYFHGLEISTVARDALNSRGSQLNSKLFKGVELGNAHQLPYENDSFDRAVATGFSCYYPIEYWQMVLQEAKRVLKPGGVLVFDAIDPNSEIAENWAILETYLGAEVFLTPLKEFEAIAANIGRISTQREGELFKMYRLTMPK